MNEHNLDSMSNPELIYLKNSIEFILQERAEGQREAFWKIKEAISDYVNDYGPIPLFFNDGTTACEGPFSIVPKSLNEDDYEFLIS